MNDHYWYESPLLTRKPQVGDRVHVTSDFNGEVTNADVNGRLYLRDDAGNRRSVKTSNAGTTVEVLSKEFKPGDVIRRRGTQCHIAILTQNRHAPLYKFSTLGSLGVVHHPAGTPITHMKPFTDDEYELVVEGRGQAR